MLFQAALVSLSSSSTRTKVVEVGTYRGGLALYLASVGKMQEQDLQEEDLSTSKKRCCFLHLKVLFSIRRKLFILKLFFWEKQLFIMYKKVLFFFRKKKRSFSICRKNDFYLYNKKVLFMVEKKIYNLI